LTGLALGTSTPIKGSCFGACYARTTGFVCSSCFLVDFFVEFFFSLFFFFFFRKQHFVVVFVVVVVVAAAAAVASRRDLVLRLRFCGWCAARGARAGSVPHT
jgi:hypothetical protein